jgi:hypothetical protein
MSPVASLKKAKQGRNIGLLKEQDVLNLLLVTFT